MKFFSLLTCPCVLLCYKTYQEQNISFKPAVHQGQSQTSQICVVTNCEVRIFNQPPFMGGVKHSKRGGSVTQIQEFFMHQKFKRQLYLMVFSSCHFGNSRHIVLQTLKLYTTRLFPGDILID